MNSPKKYYKVSIHNQIFTTIYYKVCSRDWNFKTDKYTHIGCEELGFRGKGNALGMTGKEAVKYAKALNRELNWHHKKHAAMRTKHNILI